MLLMQPSRFKFTKINPLALNKRQGNLVSKLHAISIAPRLVRPGITSSLASLVYVGRGVIATREPV